jgi:hypothetical protein
MEGVLSTLFDQPSLKNVKKPILVAIIAFVCSASGRYLQQVLASTGSHYLTVLAPLVSP